ncbi:hypothetical protein GE118_02620 [Mycoplasma sp. NEAQ87857]|uniref:hypothetical protein n=1 Tax=Mycoplasma sp. NEAQ87857 TaxID=2683967 RepID=UPI001317F871|nr:hypothetical protein [Mycoplasma sp. NEAQ87857]QGZ97688.1 hypothetical protein GE118_02620 [Mycoplasma sp. NEAQ87857]
MSKSKLFLLGIAGGLIGAALVATPVLITNSIQTKNQNQLNQAKNELNSKIVEADALYNANKENPDLVDALAVLEAAKRQGNIVLGNIYPSISSVKQATANISAAMKLLNDRLNKLQAIFEQIKLLQDKIKNLQATVDGLGSSALESGYKKELQDAIAKAQAFENEREDVNNVKNAINELETDVAAATSNFEKAKASFDLLQAKITEAEAEEAKIADDAYLASVKQDLANAIATAKTALNESTTKDQLDQALASLTRALTTAKNDLSSLSAAHDALMVKINEAKEVKVAPEQTFLNAVAKVLADAIAKAEPVLAVSNVDQITAATTELNDVLVKAKQDILDLTNAHSALESVLTEANEFKQANQAIVRNAEAVALITDELLKNATTALTATEVAPMSEAKAALEAALTEAKSKAAEVASTFNQAKDQYTQALTEAKTLAENPKYVAQKNDLDTVITAAESAIAAVEENNQTAALYTEQTSKLDDAITKAHSDNALSTYNAVLAKAKALIDSSATPATYTEAANTEAYTTVKSAVDAAEQAVTAASDPKTQTYLDQTTNLEKAIAKAAYLDAKAKTTALSNTDTTPKSQKQVLTQGLTDAATEAEKDTTEAFDNAKAILDLANAKGLYVAALDKAKVEKFNTLLANLKNDTDATLASEYTPALEAIEAKVAAPQENKAAEIALYEAQTTELNNLISSYEGKAKVQATKLYDEALAQTKAVGTKYDAQPEVKATFEQEVQAATFATEDAKTAATAYEIYNNAQALLAALVKANLELAKANYNAQVQKVNTAIADNGTLVSVKPELEAALTAANEKVAANTIEAYEAAKADLELAYAKAEYNAELLVAKAADRTQVYTATAQLETFNTSLEAIEAKVTDQTTATQFGEYKTEVTTLVSTTDQRAKTAAKDIFDQTKNSSNESMKPFEATNKAIFDAYTTAVKALTDPTDGTELEQAKKYLEYNDTLLNTLASSMYKINLDVAEKLLATLGDDAAANGEVEAYNAKSTLEAAITAAKALVADNTTTHFTTANQNLKQAVEAAKLAKAKHEYQMVLAFANGESKILYARYDTQANNQTYTTAIANAQATLTEPTVNKYNAAAKAILDAQKTINETTLSAIDTAKNNQQQIIENIEKSIADIKSSLEKTESEDNKKALVKQESSLIDAQAQLKVYETDRAKLEASKTTIEQNLTKYTPAPATQPSGSAGDSASSGPSVPQPGEAGAASGDQGVPAAPANGQPAAATAPAE